VAFNTLWIYTFGFAKYDVAAELGISEPELKYTARELIAYFNNTHQEYFDISVAYEDGYVGSLYSQAEKEHMKDVKGLLWLDYYICLAATAYVILYMVCLWIWSRQGVIAEVALGVWRGGLLALGILSVIGLIAVASFDMFFVKFHEIFFPQGNWSFSHDNHMVMMFPDGFWSDVALLVWLTGMALGALVAGIGWLVLSYTHRRECAKELI